MRKILIVAGLIAAATVQAGAQSRGHSPSRDPAVAGDPRPLGWASDPYPGGRVIYANAPGGAYIDCDPRNPSSPVRCKPDGW